MTRTSRGSCSCMVAGFSHLTWVLQTRALAYDGWNIPGARSAGAQSAAGQQWAMSPRWRNGPLPQWMLPVARRGGSLRALNGRGLLRWRWHDCHLSVSGQWCFVATAAAIPVNAALIGMAESAEHKAFQSMISWAHGADAHMHDNTWPGGSHVNFGIDVMRLNAPGTLADLKACANYAGGTEAAAAVKCPVLCIFAGQDKMTPLKAGRRLPTPCQPGNWLSSPIAGTPFPRSVRVK
ncbi:MAG: hypothetical protein R3D29_09520 [Nitratireductor sp.]